MPYSNGDSTSTRGGGGGASAVSFPITRALALTLLGAGILIFLLRHLYGSISIEAGAR